MNDQLEGDLRDAFAAIASAIPPEAGARFQEIDFHPRRGRVSTRLTVGTLAGAAAATGTAVSIVVLGGAQAAFAGWSPSPTQAASGQTTTAGSDCQSRLSAGPGPGAAGADQWSVVATDVRGPFTIVIYQSGAGNATCFTGPSFTVVSRSFDGGRSTSGSVSGSGKGSGSTSIAQGDVPVGGGPDGIATMSVSHLDLDTSSGGGPYTLVEGQSGSSVTGVTIVRSDGEQVRATTGNGWFVAWWPGSQDVASAELTTPSGESTEKLNKPSVSQPPVGGACSADSQSGGQVCSGSSSAGSNEGP